MKQDLIMNKDNNELRKLNPEDAKIKELRKKLNNGSIHLNKSNLTSPIAHKNDFFQSNIIPEISKLPKMSDKRSLDFNSGNKRSQFVDSTDPIISGTPQK